MVQNQYQLTAISTAATTSVVTGATNTTVHTVTFPLALTGAVTLEDTAVSPATYFVFPANSIGSFLLDVSCPNGLKVITAQADTVLISYQLP